MDAEPTATDPRAPYRERLAALADDSVVVSLLDAWAAEQDLDPPGEWRRIYGKLRPQRSPWALLVFQAGTGLTLAARLLERPERPEDARSGPDHPRAAGLLGWVELLRCTDDPALPGLRPVLAALTAPRVVRYHPGNRCVVHGGAGPSARYVKVFAEDTDDQDEARSRWAASVAGTLSFAVAEPHGWVADSRSSWYGVVPGEPLERRLLAPEAAGLVRQVGRSLGELAVSPLRPRRTDDDARQLARTRRSVARAAAAAPGLEPGLQEVLEVLARAHRRLRPRPLVPAHGAAHLGQWLVAEDGRLGLVDFDRFAWGEPEFDLATFLVELAATSGAPPAGPLRAAVVEGYEERAGTVDEDRLTLYLLHKRLARVARAAAGLRPDGPERAARELVEVQDDVRLLDRSSPHP